MTGLTTRVLAPSDYRRMPWKNGGGQTVEIAIGPPDADLSTFAWRVSVAEIARDGPFSSFPGVDRTLVLLQGRGMRLSNAGSTVELRTPFAPVTFAGEAALECALFDGPTRDFNLMVRRSATSAELVVVRDGARSIASAATFVCYAASGACHCRGATMPATDVAFEHTLVVDRESAAGGIEVRPASNDAVMLVAAIGFA